MVAPKQSHQTLFADQRVSTSLEYQKPSLNGDRFDTDQTTKNSNIMIDVNAINLNPNTITVTKPKTKPPIDNTKA